MAETPVVLSVVFEAVPGREDELFAQLTALIAPTRSEQGCEAYELHREVSDPTKMFFFERFKSEQALNDHVAAPYFQAFVKYREQGQDPVAAVTVRRWSRVI